MGAEQTLAMKQREATSSALQLTTELEALARRAAMAWVDDWRKELVADGRAMSGGWPGTISEARARVLARVLQELGREDAVDAPTLEAIARKSYEAARAAWLSQSERDEDDE